jgi:hypothetical protein
MKFHREARGAMTIAELMVTCLVVGVVGLLVYSLLNIGTILGAKNVAVNVAHEEARVVMLGMMKDFHSAVSLPELISDVDTNGNPVTTSTSPAPGISFQLWSMGPFQIAADAAAGQNIVQISVPQGVKAPVQPVNPPYQRLIVRTHQLESDIVSVNPPNLGTAGGTVSLTLANNLPLPINAGANHIVCFITDRCSYLVKNGALNYYGPRAAKIFDLIGNTMTNPTPFSTKLTNTGTPWAQVVAATDLSTAYAAYANRGFRSMNILLRSEVPIRARLTDFQ